MTVPRGQTQEPTEDMQGREMNWNLAAGHAVVKAAASRRTPKWGRGQEVRNLRTWGAAMLRPYESRDGGHALGYARGFGMPGEDEGR